MERREKVREKERWRGEEGGYRRALDRAVFGEFWPRKGLELGESTGSSTA